MTQPGNKKSYFTAPMVKELFALSDFVEIRCILANFYEKGKFNVTKLNEALLAIKKAGVKKVEVSPMLSKGIEGVYSDFSKNNAAKMLDANNIESGQHPKDSHSESNKTDYSYWDEYNWNFMKTLIQEVLQTYEGNPLGEIVFEWHFRHPGHNDWWYPMCDGFYDYSTPTINAYRKYLRDVKGFSLGFLNKRYGSNFSSWQSVFPPKPKIGKFDVSKRWQDFQEFRIYTVIETQKKISSEIRKIDPKREMLCWMTTAVRTASRDGIVIDKALELSKEYPGLLVALTCFDYWSLPGEVYGSLANLYNTPVDIEPVHNTMESYMRTYFNALKYPVKQINWLFWLEMHPEERPWITWVLKRGYVLDKFYGAKLIHSPVVNLFSYSDQLMYVAPKLWNIPPEFKAKENFYRALETENCHVPWITDYSDKIDISEFKTMILPENKIIRPEMIEKIKQFVMEGGKLALLGDCAKLNLEEPKLQYPLYKALGISSEDVSKGDKKIFDCGKGKVLVCLAGIDSLVDSKSSEIPLLNSKGIEFINWCGMKPSISMDRKGAASFLRVKDGKYYLAMLNLLDDEFEFKVKINVLDKDKKYKFVDLLNDSDNVVMSGSEIQEKGLPLSFSFQWELMAYEIIPLD
jgi:hypothetical protein